MLSWRWLLRRLNEPVSNMEERERAAALGGKLLAGRQRPQLDLRFAALDRTGEDEDHAGAMRRLAKLLVVGPI